MAAEPNCKVHHAAPLNSVAQNVAEGGLSFHRSAYLIWEKIVFFPPQPRLPRTSGRNRTFKTRACIEVQRSPFICHQPLSIGLVPRGLPSLLELSTGVGIATALSVAACRTKCDPFSAWREGPSNL
jgi:hypothetical protein